MPTIVTDRMPGTKDPRLTPQHCTCPECGGLECLCRPRFFAGQLLTEEELQRLDHYIVGKTKLHNRYLHGWGVVCGLNVVCDDCSDGVIVRPGYGLSPCGDDIVVCRDARVDVCALIQACQKRTRPDCDDVAPERRVEAGCAEAGDWVLAIRYHERPSRGVTPLRSGGCGCGGGQTQGCGCGGRAGGSSGGCGCGGSKSHKNGNGGCGCGGSSYKNGNGCSDKPSQAATSRFTSAVRCAAPLECEPTVVCEEFQFQMYRLPPRTDEPSTPQGAMAKRFQECLDDLTEAIPPAPPGSATQQQKHDWCCRARDGLIDYLDGHDVYDCSLPKRARDLDCPAANLPAGQFEALYLQAQLQILSIWVMLLLACLCDAFMPPCPETDHNGLLPLAVVKVTGTGTKCRVTAVCNWTTQRKFATTFPSLQYWLSILPCGRMLRESLERVCCMVLPALREEESEEESIRSAMGASARASEFGDSGADQPASEPEADEMNTRAFRSAGVAGGEAGRYRVDAPASSFHATEKTTAHTQRLTRMMLSALGDYGESLDADTLVRGAFGDKKEDGSDAFPPEAADNKLAFIALDQMVKPALRTMFPRAGRMGEMIRMVAALGGFTGAAESGRGEAESAGLASEVATLRETVARQNRDIEELRRRFDER